MAPIALRWTDAEVKPEEGGFALEIDFDGELQPHWWNAFASGIETASRETNGARWSTISKVGEPVTGLRITGIDEGSAPALRNFLEAAAAVANEQIDREEEELSARVQRMNEERRESAETAARLTQTFRTGS